MRSGIPIIIYTVDETVPGDEAAPDGSVSFASKMHILYLSSESGSLAVAISALVTENETSV